MAYNIKSVKEHLASKHYAWAVWGAAGVVMEKLYSNLGSKVRVIKRTPEDELAVIAASYDVIEPALNFESRLSHRATLSRLTA